MKAGVHTGYLITCRQHHDEGEDASKECKKALHFGKDQLDADEIKRRLKNWFILGNDPATPTLASNPWVAGRYRCSHLHFGGYRLCELASDNPDLATYGYTDEELDDVCGTIGREDPRADE